MSDADTSSTDGGQTVGRVSDGEINGKVTNSWVEVREDGSPLLCLETECGETQCFELSQQAARDLWTEFTEGPTVRHDQSHGEAGDRD